MRRKFLIKSLTAAGLVLGMVACDDGDASDSSSSGSDVDGSFNIQVSNGSGFSDDSERARIDVATDSMFGFKASGWHVRVNAREMPDSGVAETTEFGRNNTIMSMYVKTDGVRQRVGCDPADPAVGSFKRTKLTETEVSGEFTLEFVSCDDYFTAEPVEVPGLPFTVTGSFEDIKRTDL